MWTRIYVQAGQKLKIGKSIGAGCRSYLGVYGGFSNIASYFDSKSTSPLVAIGGYQGRQLASGDLLGTIEHIPEDLRKMVVLPKSLDPKYTNTWEIAAMVQDIMNHSQCKHALITDFAQVGPHDEGYFSPEDIEMIYSTEWKISHNASRSGIRLVGPVPKFSRRDGGEGGAHPSNLVEYGYPLGTLNWTGDDPCIFPPDAPNFGGFVSSTTIVRAEWWKMGQLKAGDTLRYKRVGLEEALDLRRQNEQFLDSVEKAVQSGGEFIKNVSSMGEISKSAADYGKAILWEREAQGNRPQVRYRQVRISLSKRVILVADVSIGRRRLSYRRVWQRAV